MIYVRIDYTDGQYSLRQVPKEDIPDWEKSGRKIHSINEPIWDAYLAYLNQCHVWYDLIRRMDEEEN